MVDQPASQPRFLCDAMLGSLARWLRFFGFDTLYLEPGPSDFELAAQARRDGRWLLTRDRDLAAVGPRTILVRTGVLDDQLTEVFTRLTLRPRITLEGARCGECNGILVETTADEVGTDAPPHVRATAPRFRRCSVCRRVYWPGTHSVRILRRMEGVVARL